MSGAADSTPDIASTAPRVREVVSAALDRKAEDLKVLHVGDVSGFTEYFMICSATNERQVQAIADAMIEKLRPHKIRPLGVEGYNRGHWVLMDFGSFIVHVFDRETRVFYALEDLWADGVDVTATFVS